MTYPGTPLRLNSRGEHVKAVQLKLGVHQTGIYGPTTEQNVSTFQRGRGLDVDGIVGPLTWAALFTGAVQSTDLGELALKEAKARVGVREKPLGSNRGPEVDSWNRRVGVPLGSFWCASFLWCMIEDAAKEHGLGNPVLRTASCSALYRWAREHGRLVARPEPGDIFLCIGGDTGHYHTGFVAGSVSNGRFATIEGNGSAGGSANGVGVVSRPNGRRLESCHYVRI